MNPDIEAAGALATAGLAAKAIDGHAEAKEPAPEAKCLNCGTLLQGAYCHACGQAGHVHRSLKHMFEEVLHGVLHFDSKSWRTLPLLIARPGVLTRRYIDGQRVRYVSPLALFLFMIFLMFFVVSSVVDSDTNIAESSPEERREARAELVEQLEEAQELVEERSAELEDATNDEERAEAQRALESARAEERTAAAVLALFDKATEAAETGNNATLTPEELKALTGWSLGEKTSGVVKNVRDNPELYLYKLKNTAYKFAFMLIPISLPFLWAMFFWRRNVRMYDHVVFSLYSLSFMSLLIIAIALSSTLSFTSKLAGFLVFVPPIHMFVHLRGTYGLSNFSALWRTFALGLSAGTVFVLFMILIGVISYI